MAVSVARGVRIAAAIGGVLLLALTAVALFLARSRSVDAWATARVAEVLGPRIRVGDVQVTWWPPPLAVALDAVTVLGDDGAPVLTARQVLARIRLWPLLDRRLVIASATVDGLAATLTRAADGSLKVAGLAAPTAGTASPPADLAAHLPRLSLRDSQLTVVHTALVERRLTLHSLAGEIDPRPPGVAFRLDGVVGDRTAVTAAGQIGALAPPWEALPVQVDLDIHDADAADLQPWLPAGAPLLRAPLHAHLSAQGTRAAAEGDALVEMADGSLDWAGWEVRAPLRASGHVRWADGNLALNGGALDAAAVRRGAAHVQSVHASLELDGAALTVTGATLHACGGAWSQTGRITVAGQGPIDAALHAEGVDGAQLLAALPALGAPLPPLQVEAALSIDASATAASGAALRGRVDLRASDGFVEASGVRVNAPLAMSGGLRDEGGKLAIGDGHASAQHVLAAGVEAADLDGQFSLDARALAVAALRATAYGGTWFANGRVPLDNPRAWTANVRATHVALGALLAATVGRDPDDPASRDGVADFSATLGGAPDGGARGDGSGRLTAGTFVWGPLQSGAPAHLDATFTATATGVALTSAQAQAAAASYDGLAATQAAARFSVVDDRLTFSDLRFHACGGAWTHSGWFALAGERAFAGELAIDGVDPQAVMAIVGLRVPSIEIRRGDAHGTFQGVAGDDWRQDLRSRGSVTLRDGTVRAPAILPALWQALFRRPAPFTGLERPTHIEQISASFDLSKGVVRSQDLSEQTDDYTITGAGTIGLDGSLDLETRVTLTAQGMQTLIATASVPLPTSGLPSLPPIPTTIRGTFEQPQVRPDISALPASTVRWLVGSMLEAPREIGGAVVGGLDGLFDGTRRLFGGAAPTPSR